MVEDQILASSKSQPQPSSIPFEEDRLTSEKNWSSWYYRVKKPDDRQNAPPVDPPEVKSSTQLESAKIEPSDLHVEEQAAVTGRKSSRALWYIQLSDQDEVAQETQVKQIVSTRSKQTDRLQTYRSFDSKHKLLPEHKVEKRNLPLPLIQIPNIYRWSNL